MIYRLAGAMAAVLALQGCAAVPAIGVAGAGASIFTVVKQADQDVDTVLAADRPIKQIICDSHPDKSPTFAAWCANLPMDVGGLIKQWAAVAVAKSIEDHTRLVP